MNSFPGQLDTPKFFVHQGAILLERGRGAMVVIAKVRSSFEFCAAVQYPQVRGPCVENNPEGLRRSAQGDRSHHLVVHRDVASARFEERMARHVPCHSTLV